MALILLLHDLYLYVAIGMHVRILYIYIYIYTLEHYVHTYIHARTFVRM